MTSLQAKVMAAIQSVDGCLDTHGYDVSNEAARAAIAAVMGHLREVTPDATRVGADLIASAMERQSDDNTASSIQRDRGLTWIEGWFDLRFLYLAMLETAITAGSIKEQANG